MGIKAVCFIKQLRRRILYVFRVVCRPSLPFFWARYLRNALREFLQFQGFTDLDLVVKGHCDLMKRSHFISRGSKVGFTLTSQCLQKKNVAAVIQRHSSGTATCGQKVFVPSSFKAYITLNVFRCLLLYLNVWSSLCEQIFVQTAWRLLFTSAKGRPHSPKISPKDVRYVQLHDYVTSRWYSCAT